MDDTNVPLITAMATSKDKKDDRALPWLVGDLAPTADVIEEIVNRFHVYAMLGPRKLHSKKEEEKRKTSIIISVRDAMGLSNAHSSYQQCAG